MSNHKISQLQKLTSTDAEASDLFVILDRDSDGTEKPQTKAMEFSEMTEFFNSSSAGIVNVLSASFSEHLEDYLLLSASYKQASSSINNSLNTKIDNSQTGSYISYGLPVLNSGGKIYDNFLPTAALPVTSIFGRSGSVVASGSDYSNFYVQKTGDTLTGQLNVLIAPVSPSHSTSKKYIDDISASIVSTISSASSSINIRLNQLDGEISNITSSNFSGGFKNYIMNGNFDIWQRSGSAATTSSFMEPIADRWMVTSVFSGGETLSFSRQFNDLYSTLPISARQFIRIHTPSTITVSGAQQIGIRQSIESIPNLWGKTITVSYYARASENNAKLGIHFDYGYGSGGSGGVSGSFDYGVATVDHFSLTTTWTKYSHSIELPTFPTRTYSTESDTFVAISFNIATGETHRIDSGYAGVVQPTVNCDYEIAQVQIEDGISATSFEIRPIQLELLLCRRYFRKSYPIDQFKGTISFDTGEGSGYPILMDTVSDTLMTQERFDPPMRTYPTVVVYNPATGATNSVCDVFQGNHRSVYGVISGPVGISEIQLTSDVAATRAHEYHYYADAELFNY